MFQILLRVRRFVRWCGDIDPPLFGFDARDFQGLLESTKRLQCIRLAYIADRRAVPRRAHWKARRSNPVLQRIGSLSRFPTLGASVWSSDQSYFILLTNVKQSQFF